MLNSVPKVGVWFGLEKQTIKSLFYQVASKAENPSNAFINKYLLSNYYLTGSVLDTWDSPLNRIVWV